MGALWSRCITKAPVITDDDIPFENVDCIMDRDLIDLSSSYYGTPKKVLIFTGDTEPSFCY